MRYLEILALFVVIFFVFGSSFREEANDGKLILNSSVYFCEVGTQILFVLLNTICKYIKTLFIIVTLTVGLFSYIYNMMISINECKSSLLF